MKHYSFGGSSEKVDLSGMSANLHNVSFPKSNSRVGNHYRRPDNITVKINGTWYHYFQIERSHAKVTARLIEEKMFAHWNG